MAVSRKRAEEIQASWAPRCECGCRQSVGKNPKGGWYRFVRNHQQRATAHMRGPAFTAIAERKRETRQPVERFAHRWTQRAVEEEQVARKIARNVSEVV